jgi:hypothetical protein
MEYAEALKMIARTTFRPFGENDWHAFAGVETPNPLIGECEDYTIVIDGDVVSFTDNKDDNWAAEDERFKLTSI